MKYFKTFRSVLNLNYWRFEFQPCSCWCCHTGFGKAVCDSCKPLLPHMLDGCIQCARESPQGLYYCGACLQDPPMVDELIVAQAYRWPWTQWIPEFKFRANLARGHFLARCLLEAIEKRGTELPEVLIPVPLHPKRQAMRGFNQAEVLAKPLSIWLNCPLNNTLVYRHKATQPQMELSAAQRRPNLKSAFRATGRIPFKHVAIVDDVITTRNTVEALARVLKQAGVERVSVFGGCRASLQAA